MHKYKKDYPIESEIAMKEKINFSLVLEKAIALPMVRIDRDSFLKTALSHHFDTETVSKAIEYNPAYAGISADKIKKIANAAINYETTKVTAFSATAGIPSGFAMIGTIPADLTQYFGHMLIIAQKLMYLYGWSDLFDESGQIDDETANLLTLFIGVMFGVKEAVQAVVKISEKASEKLVASIAKKAVEKGAVTPAVKKIASNIANKLSIKIGEEIAMKKIAASVIPVIGGLISGTITYVTYKPMAIRLKNHLATLKQADVSFYTR